MAEINLQEAISNARLEAQQLKEKINAQRKVINDVNSKCFYCVRFL